MGSRRLILALLGAALLLPAAAAQGAVTVGHSGWSWGSPSPQGQTVRALEFEGARGYAAGAFGTVLVTGGMLIWPVFAKLARPGQEVGPTEAVQLITVRDTTPPTFACPPPLTVECDSDVPAPRGTTFTPWSWQ